MIDAILKFFGLRHKAIGKTLIRFDTRGCMADDWRETERGTITAIGTSLVYDGSSSGRLIRTYQGMSDDGFIFSVPVANCLDGTKEMQARTDNPDEPLDGKIVCLV